MALHAYGSMAVHACGSMVDIYLISWGSNLLSIVSYWNRKTLLLPLNKQYPGISTKSCVDDGGMLSNCSAYQALVLDGSDSTQDGYMTAALLPQTGTGSRAVSTLKDPNDISRLQFYLDNVGIQVTFDCQSLAASLHTHTNLKLQTVFDTQV